MESLTIIPFKEMHIDVIEQCRAGDRKAQYQLYRLYSKAMFNICMRITNDRAESEDILQQSFLNAFEHIHSYKHEATFGAWLKKIVINNALNQKRKKKLELVFSEPGELDIEDDAYENDMQKTDYAELKVERLRNAIQKLPEGFRIVLSLFLLEGYDHAEIAQIIGISESTSKSQYHRAKKKLKEMFRKEAV